VVCSGEDIVAVFGSDNFDVVIATELLEHIKDWRVLVSNMKNACKPGGTIIITTRSRGYGYHAAPFDYWRFEVGDIARIFVDCELLSIEEDPSAPGVFAAFKKPSEFSESDLSDIQLYSIVTGKRSADIKPDDLRCLHFALQYIGSKIRHLGIWAFSFGRKDVYAKFVKQFKELAELVKTSKSSKETR
jgi:SAM-dependent methyltransferase